MKPESIPRLVLLCFIVILGSGYEFYLTRTKHDETRPKTDQPAPSPQLTPLPEGILSISGVIVAPDDQAKNDRTRLFDSVRSELGDVEPDTVILLSSNTRLSGNASIQTSSEPLQVGDVIMQPSSDIVAKAQEAGVEDEPESLRGEDGIRLLLKDIYTHFPKARLLPLTFKDDVSLDTLTTLATTLSAACRSCLMVASTNLSQNQPYLLSDLHDSVTVRLLENRDEAALLKKTEAGSTATLSLLSLWTKHSETPHLTVKQQTNSGKLSNDPDAGSKGRLFAWYDHGEAIKPSPAVSFTIGGDMMFGRMIAHTFPGNALAKVGDQLGSRLFHGADAGIINLEGPISPTPVPDNIRRDNLTFNFPPETVGALQALRVDAVSLANNHTSNAGKKGLEATRTLLSNAKVTAIGGPGDSGVPEIGSFEGEGLTLKVIGVHLLSSQPDLTPLIKELSADPKNRVLIMPHWGNEYQARHASSQEVLAHTWIDAGAAAVVGSHPHVIQDSEIYKGKPIFYSVGNLLFDQTFSQETQEGLLINGEFTEKGVELFALPVGMSKYKPLLLGGSAKKRILATLYSGMGIAKDQDPSTWKLSLEGSR